MPNYNPYIDYNSPTAKWGVGLGALISAALGAASGQNTSDALLRGAAGGVLGGGTGANFMQDWNRNASRMDFDQAYINNLIQDNLRAQNYYNLQKDQFDWQKQRATTSPEDMRYEKRMRSMNIAQEKNKIAKQRKDLQMMGQGQTQKPEDTLGKARKEYENILADITKLTSNQEYFAQDTPEKQSNLEYLNRRKRELESTLGLQRNLDTQEKQAVGTGMSDIIRKGVQDAFPKQIPQTQGTQTPQATPQTQGITAVNPQTKQRIISYDGGQTWQPVP